MATPLLDVMSRASLAILAIKKFFNKTNPHRTTGKQVEQRLLLVEAACVVSSL
jgi:hypothetical protein